MAHGTLHIVHLSPMPEGVRRGTNVGLPGHPPVAARSQPDSPEELIAHAANDLKTCYARARRHTGTGRLLKADLLDLLGVALLWTIRMRAREDTPRLRRMMIEAAASEASSIAPLTLVLVRYALVQVPPKRASAWASVVQLALAKRILPGNLDDFLDTIGGVEGAKRELA